MRSAIDMDARLGAERKVRSFGLDAPTTLVSAANRVPRIRTRGTSRFRGINRRLARSNDADEAMMLMR